MRPLRYSIDVTLDGCSHRDELEVTVADRTRDIGTKTAFELRKERVA